jgi:hypothetical protein
MDITANGMERVEEDANIHVRKKKKENEKEKVTPSIS